MFDTVSAEAYSVLRPVFTACFLMWAYLWTRVAIYYGTAAYASWISNNGRFRFVLADLFQPFWWAFKQTLCRWKIFRGATFCGTEIPSPYESGHLLRFSIFLGSLTPIAFGLQFAELDRSEWTYSQVTSTLFFSSTSIMAAGGHLFLALRTQPEGWRKLVVYCTGWLVISPFFFALWYHYTPIHFLPWYWLG